MLKATLSRLLCPVCGSDLALREEVKEIFCQKCKCVYPILGGVAILVQDVQEYLVQHVKGISRIVPDSEIPKKFRKQYLEAKSEIESEHIEEDLEAERVVSLYLMNHYLNVKPEKGGETDWWRSNVGSSSPLIDSLVREHWDSGPFAKISEWVRELNRIRPVDSVVELGCGVGGLARVLSGSAKSYLGIDSSFASIALARHLILGAPYPLELRVPGDLLQGVVSRKVRIPLPLSKPDGSIDFVVGDLDACPVADGEFDVAVVLNAIDMMPEPAVLPQLQHRLLKKGGVAIQSCPYIWHEQVARDLREQLPSGVKDSAEAVEWLYQQQGFKVGQRIEHLPWLFFKHVRQLEIYSVHLFAAKKQSSSH